MFGKRAEALAPWLRKGTKISLIGRIHTRSYQKDGQSISAGKCALMTWS